MSTIAPAARAVLAQANARFPGRDRRSDGLRGDARHERESRKSWHLPRRPARAGEDTTNAPAGPGGVRYVRDDDGVVHGVDLTHDPAGGCDAHAFVRDAVARRDPRVYEAISEGRIWTRRRADEGWREYTGAAHDQHAHLTIDPTRASDVSPWWRPAPPQPAPAPLPPEFEETPVKYVRADVKKGHDEHGKVYAVTVHGRTWMESGYPHMRWLAAHDLGPKPDPAVTKDEGFTIETWPLTNLLNFPDLGAA